MFDDQVIYILDDQTKYACEDGDDADHICEGELVEVRSYDQDGEGGYYIVCAGALNKMNRQRWLDRASGKPLD